ncbi:MAG TPA: arylsulfatase [Flavihumibacter sp.]|jgi:arylsulfatase A
MRKFILAILLLAAGLRAKSQEIGANFNHNPEIIDFEYLQKTPVEWVRTTPYIFEYIRGERNPETETGLQKLIEASRRGYKVAFGFRWDFRKHKLRIPEPDSPEEKAYFGMAKRILERVGPYIQVFKLGNEPNLETLEADMEPNSSGIVPLVRFTGRLLTEVVEPYYRKNNKLKRPDIYVGSLPRLFLKEEQNRPGVRGLIELAQQNPQIKGLAIHLHISDSLEMEEAFRYTRSIMPQKPIIVPEYSLFRLYNQHVSDPLGDTDKGRAFAAKYGYDPAMKTYEWYSKANSQRVSATEWEDFFASRPWFPPHFMQTYYRYFRRYGVVLATYGYLSQSAPAKMGPDSPTWFINPIFPMKSLLPAADGSYTPNPLWYEDFVQIVQKGKKKLVAAPNIIILYADDLGYGDVGVYGSPLVQTPRLDQLAEKGLRFTDAHSPAATCTPSRVSLLTGRYAFRNDAAILPGDAPALLRPGTQTLPLLLQGGGYTTAVIGKWHLGIGDGVINWNQPIKPGPNEIGFDYSFIIPATTDRSPTVYVENGKVYNHDPADPIQVSYTTPLGDEPTGLSHPWLLKQKADTQHSNTIINGISRIGYMTGGKKARWVDEDIPLVLNEKVKSFISANHRQPFFLYYPFPNIHVPRAPNARFAGSSRLGARGDVITEMDWMVGEVIDLLDSLGIADNTLVFFSSDNGPVLDDGYGDFAEEKNGDHRPAGIYRGGKYSSYEGGTRVPQLVYWPGKVKPGVSDALFTHVDLYATIAALVGLPVPPGAARDSENHLAVLLGDIGKGREWMLEEAFSYGLRKGKWKYIAPQQKATPDWLRNKKIETGLQPGEQLFNLKKDPGEKTNLAARQKNKLVKMRQKLASIMN